MIVNAIRHLMKGLRFVSRAVTAPPRTTGWFGRMDGRGLGMDWRGQRTNRRRNDVSHTASRRNHLGVPLWLAVVWLDVGQFCQFLRLMHRFLKDTLFEIFVLRGAGHVPELSKDEVEWTLLLRFGPYRAQGAFVGHLRQVLSVDLEQTTARSDSSAGVGNAVASDRPDEDALVAVTIAVTDDRNAEVGTGLVKVKDDRFSPQGKGRVCCRIAYPGQPTLGGQLPRHSVGTPWPQLLPLVLELYGRGYAADIRRTS